MTPPSPSRSGRGAGRRRGLHAEVVDQLGQMIVTGDPLSDVHLVTDDLAEHFEASRTVIREAFRSLESKGLIAARPNVGTYVRPVSEWNLLDPDIIEWRALGPQGVHQRSELRELRWVIETFAARLAAGTENPDVYGLLTAAVFDMEEAVRHGDANLFDGADARFHRHLIGSCRSLMLNHLSAIVTQGLTACAEPTTCDRTEACVTRHAAVVGAIREDGEAAERAMRDLLGDLLRDPPHEPPRDRPHGPPHRDADGKAPLPRQRVQTTARPMT